MSVTIEQVKCACSDCVCVVDVEQGIKKDGRIYCCDECADHHTAGAGCNHAGCPCRG